MKKKAFTVPVNKMTSFMLEGASFDEDSVISPHDIRSYAVDWKILVEGGAEKPFDNHKNFKAKQATCERYYQFDDTYIEKKITITAALTVKYGLEKEKKKTTKGKFEFTVVKAGEGYFYTKEGEFLGNIGNSDKVWVIDKLTFEQSKNTKIAGNSDKLYKASTLVYEKHADFKWIAGTLHAEGPSKWEEAAAIYSVLQNRAILEKTSVKTQASVNKKVFGATEAKVKKIDDVKANKTHVMNAYKGIIQCILTETDFSKGAYFWDGKDFNGKNEDHRGYDARYKTGYKFANKSHDLWNQVNYKKPGENSFNMGKNPKQIKKWDYKHESTAAIGNTTFTKLTDDWRSGQMPGKQKSNEMGN